MRVSAVKSESSSMQSEKLRCLARDISELGQQGTASSGHDANDIAEDTVRDFCCVMQDLRWNVVDYQRQVLFFRALKLLTNIIAVNNRSGKIVLKCSDWICYAYCIFLIDPMQYRHRPPGVK